MSVACQRLPASRTMQIVHAIQPLCVAPDAHTGFFEFAQLGVAFGNAAKLSLTGFDPDAPPPDLHILLDHALAFALHSHHDQVGS
jgi:hypothetical protein